jgi:hypothetical protein
MPGLGTHTILEFGELSNLSKSDGRINDLRNVNGTFWRPESAGSLRYWPSQIILDNSRQR